MKAQNGEKLRHLETRKSCVLLFLPASTRRFAHSSSSWTRFEQPGLAFPGRRSFDSASDPGASPDVAASHRVALANTEYAANSHTLRLVAALTRFPQQLKKANMVSQ